MKAAKKTPGNQDEHLKPINVSSKKTKAAHHPATGNTEANGGSREGNAGHQNESKGNVGNR